MPVVSVELTILVFVSLSGVSLDFFGPLDKFLMFDLCEHVHDVSIEGRENQLWTAWWSTRTPFIGLFSNLDQSFYFSPRTCIQIA